jgi:hypothetical protein
MKYIDPTKARIARDNEIRKREREMGKSKDIEGGVRCVFREAAGNGKHSPMQTTQAVYKAVAKKPRKVL